MTGKTGGRRSVAAVWLVVLALLTIAVGCQQLKARDQLNKGVHAYKLAKYAEAVEFFRRATELDKEFHTARLYLATAYMSQYIPGAESPENVEMAKNAQDEFMRVLESNPKDTVAIASIASLMYHQKKLDEAEKWYVRLAETDPANKEALYSLGNIIWAKCYPKTGAARAQMGMKPEDPGPLKDKKVREELRAELMPRIEQGLQYLQKALEIDPEYDDAMGFVNLLYRQRADLQDTPALYKADIDKAEEWVNKTMETKKMKAARAAEAPGGAVVTQ
jgi:tetratricopeptide (TPR) repeat protein